MTGDHGEPTEGPIRELSTVRDWLRYAVSRFERAGLCYGHGTTNALDEAAFLLLHTLALPIGELEPFLDARLLMNERRALSEIIERRIASRKPAAYLTGRAWIGPHAFEVDERVIVPRALLGELLVGGDLIAHLPETELVGNVLDLCTGSGCLAILAALAFPKARIDAVELSSEALTVARKNIDRYGLLDRLTLHAGDLFAPVAGCRYDLIIANPPYVATAEVAAFPPEYAAEPALAHLGGIDGLDLARRILRAARRHLTEDGVLVMEIGTGGHLLEAEFAMLPFLWLDTVETAGEVLLITAADLARLPGRTPPRPGKSPRRTTAGQRSPG